MALFSLLLLCLHAQAQTEPLPSWADRPAKQAILDLVKATTDRANSNFVPPEARIATFDQDGTTWVEHPIYTQIVYCLERVPALVKAKPELKYVEPFKTVLSGNREAIAKLPTKELLKILAPILAPQTCEGRSPGNKGKMQWRPWRDWPYCNVLNFASWNRLCNRADTDVNDWDVTDRWGPDDGTWE